MADHRKRPRDPAQLTKLMIDIASGEVEDRELAPSLEGKDAAAVSLGRRGGLKGGKARTPNRLPVTPWAARAERNKLLIFSVF
jgi:hypothetical protein